MLEKADYRLVQAREVAMNWCGIPLEKLGLKRHWKLWVKFHWYKYVRRVDIIGFFGGVPIVRTNYLEADLEEESKNISPE